MCLFQCRQSVNCDLSSSAMSVVFSVSWLRLSGDLPSRLRPRRTGVPTGTVVAALHRRTTRGPVRHQLDLRARRQVRRHQGLQPREVRRRLPTGERSRTIASRRTPSVSTCNPIRCPHLIVVKTYFRLTMCCTSVS